MNGQSGQDLPPIPRGLDNLWHAADGLLRQVVPRRSGYLRQAHRALKLSTTLASCSDTRLKRRLEMFSARFRRSRISRMDRLSAVAAIDELIRRVHRLNLYPEQIAGALALFDGHLVEMATGEGKSITATVPAILLGWRRRGCHVVTVNDYLAKRDAVAFEEIYKIAGLRVGYLEQAMQADQRRIQYRCDITYGTNKEFCADYQRDIIAARRYQARPTGQPLNHPEHDPWRVQRGLYACIVDEADSVLIDEATVPLMIADEGKNDEQLQAYRQAADVVKSLQAERDYRLNPRFRSAELTSRGRDLIVKVGAELGGLWRSPRRAEELATQMLTARHFHLRDKQYVVQDGKVIIVDEATGRLMPDHTWRNGIHQAVEALENVEINPVKETIAQMSFQRFFRLYRHLCGMSGTLAEVRAEMWRVYRRSLVRIPTHRPCIRKHRGCRIYPHREAKYQKIMEEIRRAHQTRRPVLIGTRHVEASEHLSGLLNAENLEHCVLNAYRVAQEAEIVARAGECGRLTIATNMAGRGTDIRLDIASRNQGGLLVIATEFHTSARVDRQLAGRAGRQGDPGENIVYASLDDELFMVHSRWLARLCWALTGSRQVPSPLAWLLIRISQGRAERFAAANRIATALSDEQMEESLGFAGRID